MKKILLLSLTAAALVFASCENDLIPDDPEGQTDLTTRSLGDGKYDILGYGYDVTDKFADGLSSSRSPVLRAQDLGDAGFINEMPNVNETMYSHFAGMNIIDISRNMSDSVGIKDINGFSGSFNAGFRNEYKFNSKYSYAYYAHEFVKAGYSLRASVSEMKGYLDPIFVNHVQTQSPAFIVQHYGTHVLTNLYVGAKLEAFMESKTTVSTKVDAVNAKLGATFEKLFNLNVNFSYDRTKVNSNQESKLFYKTIGGNMELTTGELLMVDGSTMPRPSLNVAAWTASLSSVPPRFIRVIDNKAFIPIYEFVDDPVKKSALKKYIDQYVIDHSLAAIDNYDTFTGVRSVQTDKYHTSGAGVAVCDINRNGKKDMVFMLIDDPDKDNHYYYQILYDVNEYGSPAYRSSLIYLAKTDCYHNQGGAIAACDLNKNGITDLVFACADSPKGANPIKYRVAWDIGTTGIPRSISESKVLPSLGNEYDGMGISIADLNNNGMPEIVFMAYDAPTGENEIRYKVGFDLNSQGNVTGGCSDTYYKLNKDMGSTASGAGVAIADINRNGRPDLFVAVLDVPSGQNKFRYKIAWDLDRYGRPTGGETEVFKPAPFEQMDFGLHNSGADCTIADIDGDGIQDLVLLCINNPSKANDFRYVTGLGFTKYGYIQYWR